MFVEQLIRIRNKLALAKAKDPSYETFGADGHEYELNEPADPSLIKDFEQKYNVELPPDFIEFITKIAHGGAGPFYGVYQLGDFGYMVGSENTMGLPCLVNSGLTAEHWKKLTAFDEVEVEHGDAYYEKCDALFVGMLPIGTQGCSFQSMLILNGDLRGRVVNIDQDLQIPIVSKEKNFLDWYEAWLDKILES